jgi:hypothetical protein
MFNTFSKKLTLKNILLYILTLLIILSFKNFLLDLVSEIQNWHIIIASLFGYILKLFLHSIIDVAESELKLPIGGNLNEEKSDTKIPDVLFKNNEEGSSKDIESKGKVSTEEPKGEEVETESSPTAAETTETGIETETTETRSETESTETDSEAEPERPIIIENPNIIPQPRVLNPNYREPGSHFTAEEARSAHEYDMEQRDIAQAIKESLKTEKERNAQYSEDEDEAFARAIEESLKTEKGKGKEIEYSKEESLKTEKGKGKEIEYSEDEAFARAVEESLRAEREKSSQGQSSQSGKKENK